ncbi:unnamed protein product [Pocillopora meandrina]|uniref:G-protein coupled receptors family 1 profile domain-containing protein n=1 Tax=Pocillopora meandrina TaxID=46732 RepID=A0AAU9WSS4_9CNID|nr:unnamed protein product [Pocillopora meandrina]
MFHTYAIVILCIICVESLLIFICNTFTIFVFWKNRNKLKRTTFLLINLAVADLLVELIQLISTGAYNTILQIQTNSTRAGIESEEWIWAVPQVLSPHASIFFLVLISLKRAYALIWPLRHRVASIKGYIYSAIFVWASAIALQTLSLLVTYRKILNFDHWMIAISCIAALFLITICACYLTIRAKLSSIGLAAVAGKGNSLEQNMKLSRAFFTVTAASLVCWAPSSVGYFIFHLSSKRCPMAVVHSIYIFYLGNSLVHPNIYSLKFPMFRNTLQKMRPKKGHVVMIYCIILFESLIIFLGNTFTVFVFWKNRNKLKRTSFLLINLAVTDLFVGLSQMISTGGIYIPGYTQTNSTHGAGVLKQWILAVPSLCSPYASLFFLVFISLERAYALIWPLRHRVASFRGYIYSAIFVWAAATTLGALTLLIVKFKFLNLDHWMVALACIAALSLTTVCACYVKIRARLSSNARATVANKDNTL